MSRLRKIYDAVLPFPRQLAERFPDRIVGGSDWPHVGATTPLLNLLASWVPDQQQRRRILVDDSNALYGLAP